MTLAHTFEASLNLLDSIPMRARKDSCGRGYTVGARLELSVRLVCTSTFGDVGVRLGIVARACVDNRREWLAQSLALLCLGRREERSELACFK